MLHFQPITLSTSGRPVPLENEIELMLQSSVALYDGDASSPKMAGGVARITSHRIIYSCEDFVQALPLALIAEHEKLRGLLLRSPKIKLTIRHAPPGSVRLSFRASGGGGCEQFYEFLCQALQKQAWTEETTKSPSLAKSAPRPFDPLSAGVSGVERRVAEQAREQKEDMGAAFRDLQQLMGRAREMVQLAEKFANHMRKPENDGSGGAKTEQFGSIALSMGFSSPVTRETAGDLYYPELARQICDLLRPHVQQANGMLSLADCYCLVNRSRGISLVSPDDVVRASRMLETLGLPLRLRGFKSGVLVLQDITHSDAISTKRIVDLLTNANESGFVGMTASEISQKLDMSLAIANEQLLAAESNGELARDETVEGIRFFPNLLAQS